MFNLSDCFAPWKEEMAPRNKTWTTAEDAELTRLAASGIDRISLARKLNRTVSAVESRGYKLGVQLPLAFRRKRLQRAKAK